MSPENMNHLIVILGVIAGIYVVMKLAGKVLKVVGIALVIGLAFYFWQGGSVDGLKEGAVKQVFKDTPISELMQKFCQEDKQDKARCMCIVTPVHNDLHTRLSAAELQEVDADPARRSEEIRTSLKNKKKDIRKCLINNKGKEYIMKLWGFMKNDQEGEEETPAPEATE